MLEALVRSRAENPDTYRKLVEWLLQGSAYTDTVLRNAADVHALHRAQGASGTLFPVIEVLSDPETTLAELRAKRAGVRLNRSNSGRSSF